MPKYAKYNCLFPFEAIQYKGTSNAIKVLKFADSPSWSIDLIKHQLTTIKEGDTVTLNFGHIECPENSWLVKMKGKFGQYVDIIDDETFKKNFKKLHNDKSKGTKNR